MVFRKADKILKGENALDLIPIAKHGYIQGENDLIVLQIPKFKNEKFARWFIPKHKSIYYSIKMDDLGTKVYCLIDGKRSIARICNLINDNEESPIENLEERAVSFLVRLYKYRFITFDQLLKNKINIRRKI